MVTQAIGNQSENKLALIAAQHSSWYAFWVVLRCFGGFTTGYFAALLLYSINDYLVLLAPILYGWGGYRLQFILHDCTHNSLFKSHRINRTVGDLAGVLVGVNFARYRFTHIWHHRRNGQISDPQFFDYLGNYSIEGADRLSRTKFLWFVLAPLFGLRLFGYLKREVSMTSIENRPAPRVPISWYLKFVTAQLVILGGSLLVTRNLFVPISLITGLCTVSLFLARLRALAEHQKIDTYEPDFTRSHEFNIFDFIILYDANFNFHLEHHLYPYTQSRNLRFISELSSGTTPSLPPPIGQSMFKTIFSNFKSLRW